MTFYGKPRGDAQTHDHAHESPKSMLVPLGVLALGSVFSGMIWYNSFFGDEAKMRDWFGMEAGVAHSAAESEAESTEAAPTETATTGTAPIQPAETAPATDLATTEGAPEAAAIVAGAAPKGAIFLGPQNTVLEAAHEAPDWVKVSPFIAMILGLALAWVFYIRRPDLPGKLAAQQRPLYLFLLNKWYFDEVYDVIFVRPAFWIGRMLWTRGDGAVIDGALNGVAMGIIPFFTRLAARAQSGYVFSYAFAMVLGVGALITWMTLMGGR